jgi:RNA polymerase sigma factor (sigma-70 family)
MGVNKPVEGDAVEDASQGGAGEGARKRVAVEMLAKHERALRRTARRYSICAADADDAFQRAMEILLVKAPPGEARELVRWMQTVTKHEALAIRRSRERQLGRPGGRFDSEEEAGDWLSLIPSQGAGPAERVERREAIARSREALQTLKPAELKALTLLAEGYSYAEIGEMTGFSRTKDSFLLRMPAVCHPTLYIDFSPRPI